MILGATSLSYSISPPIQSHPDLVFALICLTCVIASITDVTKGKIKNWLTLPLICAAPLAALIFQGGDAALQSLSGLAVALLAFGILFATGILGAGDVKFLMALSAWAGPGFALSSAILSLFVGAFLSLLQLAYHGRLISFLKRMYRFVLTLLVKEMQLEKPKVDKKLTFPFAIPISVAGIWTFLENPLKKWGIL
ncbi:MAG: prepilin peptidase [Bdellovibrionales bacterium]|nr:prepilin peptidase [Bdellovibrionales bacterium]